MMDEMQHVLLETTGLDSQEKSDFFATFGVFGLEIFRYKKLLPTK